MRLVTSALKISNDYAKRGTITYVNYALHKYNMLITIAVQKTMQKMLTSSPDRSMGHEVG